MKQTLLGETNCSYKKKGGVFHSTSTCLPEIVTAYTTCGGGRVYIGGYEWCKRTDDKELPHFLRENIKNRIDTLLNFKLILKYNK